MVEKAALPPVKTAGEKGKDKKPKRNDGDNFGDAKKPSLEMLLNVEQRLLQTPHIVRKVNQESLEIPPRVRRSRIAK